MLCLTHTVPLTVIKIIKGSVYQLSYYLARWILSIGGSTRYLMISDNFSFFFIELTLYVCQYVYIGTPTPLLNVYY